MQNDPNPARLGARRRQFVITRLTDFVSCQIFHSLLKGEEGWRKKMAKQVCNYTTRRVSDKNFPRICSL